MSVLDTFNREEIQSIHNSLVADNKKLREKRELLTYQYLQTQGRSHTIRKALKNIDAELFSNECLGQTTKTNYTVT